MRLLFEPFPKQEQDYSSDRVRNISDFNHIDRRQKVEPNSSSGGGYSVKILERDKPISVLLHRYGSYHH